MTDHVFRLKFGPQADKTPAEAGSLLPKPTRNPRRLLVLSDIHANWPALVAVLEHAQGRYDSIWSLGDVVGYGPHPVECVEFLLRYVTPLRWRVGNHDLAMYGRLPAFSWNGAGAASIAAHKLMLQQAGGNLWEQFGRYVTLERGGPVVRNYGEGQQVFTHANLENNMEDYLFPSWTFSTRPNLYRLRNYLS